MGFTQAHAMGWARRAYAKRETTFGTFAAPAGTDALKTLMSKMTFEPGREDRVDARGTRQLLERITGIQKVSGQLEGYICPSGTAGTPPNLHAILLAAMGKYTNSPGASDTYELDDTQPPTSTLGVAPLSIVHEYSGVFSESAYGCIVDGFKISGQGPSAPKIAIDWQGVGHIHTGATTQVGPSSSTTITVPSADFYNFEVGSLIKIGANDNSGAGFRVVSKTTPPTYNMVLNVAPSSSAGAIIVPFVPTEVTAGSPCSGAVGNFTFAGLSGANFPITDYEVELKNNVEIFYDEAQTLRAREGTLGFASIKGSVGIRARRDLMAHLGSRKNFSTVAISIVLGTGAGKICTISLPTVEIDPSAIEVPQDKHGAIKLPFTALGTGAGGTSGMSIAFT